MTDSIPKTNPIFTNEIVYQEAYAGEIRKDKKRHTFLRVR